LWEERAGRNEALFREVNERVLELTDLGDLVRKGEFVCECSRDDCRERLSAPITVYEAVRANPRRFLVKPGHETTELEVVVEQTPEFFVVEKDGAAGRVADQTDPRA
jgi:hypothetical protein